MAQCQQLKVRHLTVSLFLTLTLHLCWCAQVYVKGGNPMKIQWEKKKQIGREHRDLPTELKKNLKLWGEQKNQISIRLQVTWTIWLIIQWKTHLKKCKQGNYKQTENWGIWEPGTLKEYQGLRNNKMIDHWVDWRMKLWNREHKTGNKEYKNSKY